MKAERYSSTDIATGAEVLTTDGAKLGKVKEVSDDSFKVDAPMQPDYWLDFTTIDMATRQAVTVGVTRDEIDQVKIKR